MGYLLQLRQFVGHRPLISTGAATLVYNSKNQLLLVYRTDTHLWGLPSGSKELNEALEMTAIREVAEETGIRISAPTFKTLLSGPQMQFKYPNGDQIDAVIVVYQATATDQPLLPQAGETERVRYFSLNTLPAPDQLTGFSAAILKAAALIEPLS